MTTYVRRPLITNIVDLLKTETGRPFGDGAAPSGGDDRFPYGIVYAIPGGGFEGPPLGNPTAIATQVIQINCVAKRRDQADWLMDLSREIMMGRDDTSKYTHEFQDPAGQSVLQRRPDGGPGGIETAGRSPHRIYTATERFRIDTSNTA